MVLDDFTANINGTVKFLIEVTIYQLLNKIDVPCFL